MRRSKARKQAKKNASKASRQLQKDIKAKKKASKDKYQEWLVLPEDKWSEARLAHKNSVLDIKE
jgi:hypothetical protein